MVDYPQQHEGANPARGEAARAAAAVGLCVTLAVVALPLRQNGAAWAGVALYGAVAAVLLARMGRHYPCRRFGAANAVTLARAGGVAVFAAVAAEPAVVAAAGGWILLGAALGLLALDGIDGWLARRQGLANAFGARFDMEVDALFILVLALIAWSLGKAGVWVLGLGLMRYGFLAAGRVLPWLAAPLPPSLARKAVCVLQIAVLAILLAPPVAPPSSQALAALAFLALAWSFGRDIRWLHRRRRG